MIGELTHEAIGALLSRLHIGHLGVFGDGRVFVFPVSYGYEGDYIYIESHEGLKIRLMRKHPEVCFQIEEIDGPGRWRSAMVHGLFEELPDEADRDRVFAIIAAQGEARAPDSIAPYIDGPGDIVAYRIRVSEMSGCFEQDEPILLDRVAHPAA